MNTKKIITSSMFVGLACVALLYVVGCFGLFVDDRTTFCFVCGVAAALFAPSGDTVRVSCDFKVLSVKNLFSMVIVVLTFFVGFMFIFVLLNNISTKLFWLTVRMLSKHQHFSIGWTMMGLLIGSVVITTIQVLYKRHKAGATKPE